MIHSRISRRSTLKYRPRRGRLRSSFRTTVVKYQYAYEYVTQFKPVRSNTDRTVAHRPPKTAPSLFEPTQTTPRHVRSQDRA
jgi:hypothetical protein